ncbi:pyridoxamine 5'-phosphate oxidase family protein [Roseicyclus sp. F158]|uniref:Pyridoxamine 5'-phosphate oxidase family protein n=1 Tax=Tropicimonas omnivorans TaxID=3075590 RepID=A0ABU3DG21_9RHOB|nr:pyridoxamine 5'-phosphate oxidase family protein [Roseicyclus sp. F158]MDT0682660.1 pyridoxamine 5'-phosphate oxidase family protein [Roseicyclus sp. F158]
MAEMTLPDIAERMKAIDFTMLSTHCENGSIAARPMSNNRDVTFDGTSRYFTFDESQTVTDIERDPKVGLSLVGKDMTFLSIEGTATLHRDRATMEPHWVPDLEEWFKDGLDTPGLVMIEVAASRVHWWADYEDGEIKL